MWPFGSMYTRPRPCMRNACSTQSTYSSGVSSPIMSVRPRINVLRLRQLSAAIGRFYDQGDGVEQRLELDLPGLRQERGQPPAGVLELSPGALALARLRQVARSR